MNRAKALRADTGIDSYDRAVWTNWVPEIVGCVADPVGMSSFYQDVPTDINQHKSNGILRHNECVVEGGDNACLLIWDRGCPRISETRFAGQEVAVELKAGQGILIPPNTDSKWVSNADTLSGIMHLHFTPSLIDRIRNDLSAGFNIAEMPLVLGYGDPEVVASARWLFRETRTAPPTALMWETASAFLALQLVKSLDRSLATRPPCRGGLATWQLRRVTEYMAANFKEEVRLEELASLTGLSVFHFARAFKRTTGVAPHARQIELRVENARLLLATTDRPITDIAFEVGYGNSQSLARVFARKMGISPSRYRHERRR